jgi:hypothetical protein
MGRYSDNLAKRMRGQRITKAEPMPDVERLKCAAIVRDGKVHDGLRSHYELRSAMGDPMPQTSNLNDTEGFLTTSGRFVTREEAQDVALAAGQIRSAPRRQLLSSDIDW